MTKTSTNLKYWLALKLVDGLGNMGIKNLLQSFGTKDFRQWAAINEELEKARELNVAIITCEDHRFPQRLLHIYDCPVLLYVKGDLRDLDMSVAVVGSRQASANIQRKDSVGTCP